VLRSVIASDKSISARKRIKMCCSLARVVLVLMPYAKPIFTVKKVLSLRMCSPIVDEYLFGLMHEILQENYFCCTGNLVRLSFLVRDSSNVAKILLGKFNWSILHDFHEFLPRENSCHLKRR